MKEFVKAEARAIKQGDYTDGLLSASGRGAGLLLNCGAGSGEMGGLRNAL